MNIHSNTRSDLAVELLSPLDEMPSGGKGYSCRIKKRGPSKTTIIDIEDERGEEFVGKPMGRYVTVEVPPFGEDGEYADERLLAVENEIYSLVPKKGSVLIVGLGNRDITADALGPLTLTKILATRHLKDKGISNPIFDKLREVSAIIPGVLGQTGIEVSSIVKSVADLIKPDVIITVDALAARDLERLGCTIQITDSGVSPGSGIGNNREAINRSGLGIPVISIGVPTVIGMANITDNEAYGDMVVTTKDVDLMVDRASRLVALAINKALFRTLTLDDIVGLCGA